MCCLLFHQWLHHILPQAPPTQQHARFWAYCAHHSAHASSQPPVGPGCHTGSSQSASSLQPGHPRPMGQGLACCSLTLGLPARCEFSGPNHRHQWTQWGVVVSPGVLNWPQQFSICTNAKIQACKVGNLQVCIEVGSELGDAKNVLSFENQM